MATTAEHNAFKVRINGRRRPEVSHEGHISIEDLRTALKDDNNKIKIQNDLRTLGQHNYETLKNLSADIPNYPTPVEFHISEVSHVTDMAGLDKIWESEGFKSNADGNQETFSWWSLKINEDSIQAAEKRYLENVFPNRSQEQIGVPFLRKFTTSPAFHIKESRYGNFRFTLPLKKLMETYKEQFCGGQNPVLREYKTIFYRKEIMYAVVVHSPDHNERFENFSEITHSPFVSFVDGDDMKIVWIAQAIGNILNFELTLNKEDKRAEVVPYSRNCKYYVWDHVCLAFHFDGVLKFPKETLKECCTPCRLADINLAKGRCCSYEKAQERISSLM